MTKATMLLSQTGWDYRRIIQEPSAGYRLFVLFLLLTGVVAIAKLVKTWRGAPPFRLSARKDSLSYLQELQATAVSLGQWIGFTLLGSGIFASVSFVDVCHRLLDEQVLGLATLVIVLGDYSFALSMVLFAVLFLYLVRWHVLRRIEYLRKSAGGPPVLSQP
jgi:hypothetical protein